MMFDLIIFLQIYFLFLGWIELLQTYLQSASGHMEEMRVIRRDTEQWMAYRLLPEHVKQRILRHDQYRWQETQGVDEEGLLINLPKDLRRDIKRHLCLSLLMRVLLPYTFTFKLYLLIVIRNCFDLCPIQYVRLKPIMIPMTMATRFTHRLNVTQWYINFHLIGRISHLTFSV